jgi:hypothetical protein
MSLLRKWKRLAVLSYSQQNFCWAAPLTLVFVAKGSAHLVLIAFAFLLF